MKLLADENLALAIVEILQTFDPELLSIREYYSGVDDIYITDLALKTNAIIVTEDKDFGELTYQLKIKVPGIVLIRLSGISSKDKCIIVKAAFQEHGSSFYESFTVISKTGIRIRNIKQAQ